MTAEPSQLPRMLPYALQYAERGWRVFPLHAPDAGGRCSCGADCGKNGGKHPRTKHGVKDATTEEKQIRAWWAEWPAANIGIATGHGLAVVDIDPRHDGDKTWAELARGHADAEETLECSTGGGGRHLFWFVPAGTKVKSKSNALGPGVDIRGDGGYVVAAPSLHLEGRRYAWVVDRPVVACPPWLLDLICPKPAPKPRPVATVRELTGSRYVEAAVRGEISRVADAVEGARNETLNRASYSLGQLVGGGGLAEGDAVAALTGAGLAAGLTEHEVSATVKSGLESGKAAPRAVPEPRGAPRRSATTPPQASTAADGAMGSTGPQDEDWRERLTVSKGGRLDGSINNVAIILRRHEAWAGALAHDGFAHRDVWTRDPPWDGDEAPVEGGKRVVTDGDEARLACWLRRVEGIKANDRALRGGMRIAAEALTVHPVLDYLRGLRWDGCCRLEAFAATYLGADIADRHAVMGCYRWLLAAVQRVRQPGVQCDSVLVFEGPQGVGKSSALRLLCGDEWFADDIGDPGNRDAAIALNGKWIVELGELRWRRSDEDTRKAFLTRRTDHYRPPYGRRAVDVDRQCVFAGSTNARDWQTDQTGARRYWAVRCGRIDREALALDRDQIWAEAYLRACDGERHWLEGDEIRAQQEALEGRREEDPWEEAIEEYLAGELASVTVSQVLERGIRIDVAKIGPADSRRAAACMRRAGWEQSGWAGKNKARVRAWTRANP